MSRKKRAIARPIQPDERYSNVVVSKFIQRMMYDGKRSVSKKCLYGAMDFLKEKGDKDELELFLKALSNVKPQVEVRSRRVGGSTYQIPVDIRDSRKEALAMRWIIQAARKRTGKSMGSKLGAELLDACNGTGAAFKRKRTPIEWQRRTKLLPTIDGNRQFVVAYYWQAAVYYSKPSPKDRWLDC